MGLRILLSRPARIAAAALIALILAPAALSPAQARSIWPNPATAHADKAAPFYEGCMVGIRGTKSNACLYGDPHGGRVLFLFGDSHALQDFPALQVDARRRHWRLVVLTKRDCTPGSVAIRYQGGGERYGSCGRWRHHALGRIEKAGARGIVAISGDTAYTAYGHDGEVLYGKANAAALEAGYLATIRQLRASGAAVIVIRNTPEAPFDMPDCVAADIADPSACDFPLPREPARNFDVRAAHRSGAPLVDLTGRICPQGLCRAVIDGLLVYRDDAHLTATFARTLAPWLRPALADGLRLDHAAGRGASAQPARTARPVGSGSAASGSTGGTPATS